ncbi:hypothetical protein G9A89_019815 [Geosiphon pyriformis]|nr:hypothetical protein G9A89_019815 [Geosiphon pyriformis]
MHLEFTLPVFAPASVMVSASQMAATSFVAQTQDPNEQQQNCGPPVCYYCGLTEYFSRDCNNSLLFSPAPRNNDNQNNRIINNNVPNQRPNHANINFFEENLLVKSESANQPEENPFYVFNLIDDNHDIDKLAINTSESTRKKKKTKVDFALNPNKTSKSTVNNNELPKAKVFKNPPKLKSPEIVQKFGLYSVVKDLIETSAHITFGQLMTNLQFRKDLCKSLIPKKKTPKTNKHLCQAGLVDNSNVTSLICKAQVAGYFIDLILDSGLSVNVIAKHFLKAIGKKINKPSTRLMTNIHVKAVPVRINSISIETNMEVSEAKEYTIIKAKALLDYKLCELIIRCGEKLIVQNQEEEQSDKSNDDEKETAELTYTIFTSNNKPLDNVKANKEEIMQNTAISSMVFVPNADVINFCIPLEPISLISREELKEVQKFFESEPPEIQSLVIKQKEPSPEERKVDIKNLLARNSLVISKKDDTPG